MHRAHGRHGVCPLCCSGVVAARDPRVVLRVSQRSSSHCAGGARLFHLLEEACPARTFAHAGTPLPLFWSKRGALSEEEPVGTMPRRLRIVTGQNLSRHFLTRLTHACIVSTTYASPGVYTLRGPTRKPLPPESSIHHVLLPDSVLFCRKPCLSDLLLNRKTVLSPPAMARSGYPTQSEVRP
jgi:hypothetical protein